MPRKNPGQPNTGKVTKEIVNATLDVGTGELLKQLSIELHLMPEGTPNASLMVRKMIDEFMDAHKADPRIDSRTLKKYQEIRKNRLRG